MITELYETKNKNDIVDSVNNFINSTINNFIDDDTYFITVPILSNKEITQSNAYFKNSNITPEAGLTSDEYKTISYIAPFYKEKVKYSVNNIDKYLKMIGYELEEQVATILCLDRDKEYNDQIEENYITLEEYFKLDYVNEFNHTIISNIKQYKSILSIVKTDIVQDAYIDGFDIAFDVVGMK